MWGVLMNRYISYVDVKNEVLNAFRNNTPVVALESTIISHGIPYPDNLKTALTIENCIRELNVTPATIAIINGRIKIGLEIEEIEFLATSENILKVSKKDISYAITTKSSGATTVASTIILAEMSGINIFATGEIGGIHRNTEKTFDISADLTALAHTNVTVVCAGAKSILDIGLALEKLETYGIPVLGYKTHDFPSFYTHKSGYKIDYSVDSPLKVAELMKVKWDLGLEGGIIIANPVTSVHEVPHEKVNQAIETALNDSINQKISGKEVTPFLLSKVKKLTNDENLQTNIALIQNNAILAAKIAIEYCNLQ